MAHVKGERIKVKGERIRELRNKMGLSQEQLGKMLDYSGRAAISKIETGVNDISTEKLNEFACALGTSAAYLLGDTDISQDQWHSIDEKPISLTYEEENLIKLLRGLPQGDCAKVYELAESLSHDIAEEASHDGQ